MLWAQGCGRAEVEIDGRLHALTSLKDGYFGSLIEGVGAGARYRFRLDGGPAVPDLASRCQPDGNDGASMVVDPTFDWTDSGWTGVSRQDAVLYELHIGTFTPEGTWAAAAEKLPLLKALGVTILQVMPVGTFKGKFGWGYDVTLPYAPFAPYGTPHDMRRFVDQAHAEGLGVILDVVYNHVGMGDHFRHYGDHWFSRDADTEWGASFNYDGPHNRAVRGYICGNAAYWIEEFHLDGLRIDAAQALHDKSAVHILTELTAAARAAAGKRSIYVHVENQPQERLMIKSPEAGGHGVDSMLNDDFQHAVRVAATGHDDYYYRDYRGTPQELVSALKYGFLYQGQRSDMRDKAYGTPNLDTPPEHFVHFLENHDQVANSARGFRLPALMSPARLRAVTALLLLGPQTPCLFQGQEWGPANPFLYFMALEGDEAAAVAEGRHKSLSNFPGVGDPAMQVLLADPADPKTFNASKLDWSERERHAQLVRLHTDLLKLRRELPGLRQSTPDRRIDGAVIGDAALLMRYRTSTPDQDLMLMLNLGRDLQLGVVAEPLLAPPDGHGWQLHWSSEHPEYDGAGRRPADPERFWILPGDCALLFRSEPRA
jgi:maltooligosyltrehalose trehalohydrolase